MPGKRAALLYIFVLFVVNHMCIAKEMAVLMGMDAQQIVIGRQYTWVFVIILHTSSTSYEVQCLSSVAAWLGGFTCSA